MRRYYNLLKNVWLWLIFLHIRDGSLTLDVLSSPLIKIQKPVLFALHLLRISAKPLWPWCQDLFQNWLHLCPAVHVLNTAMHIQTSSSTNLLRAHSSIASTRILSNPERSHQIPFGEERHKRIHSAAWRHRPQIASSQPVSAQQWISTATFKDLAEVHRSPTLWTTPSTLYPAIALISGLVRNHHDLKFYRLQVTQQGRNHGLKPCYFYQARATATSGSGGTTHEAS